MMAIGIRALPIVTLLSATIGLMLALQGIYSLRQFGAEQQVVLRRRARRHARVRPADHRHPGRREVRLRARGRLGTMTISNEIDALRVMGVNPVRFLVVPSLLACLVMLPCLVVLVGAGRAGRRRRLRGRRAGHHLRRLRPGGEPRRRGPTSCTASGRPRSSRVLIALVGIVDGSAVKGGAEGVGRVTTNAVVHGITAIVFTDMLFVFATTR